MTIRAAGLICFFVIIALFNPPLKAEDEDLVFYVKKVSVPPEIDGLLGEEEWKGAEIIDGDWTVFSPAFGAKLGQRTIAYAAYDDDALYFALCCFDTEPNKIKTYIGKRDDCYNGDWFAVLLDTFNTKQSCYGHYGNPSGCQGDMIRYRTDTADDVDWVWELAGRVNEEGYFVEMRIPLTSIRYRGGKEARMGVGFRRAIKRLGVCANWPDQPPGKGPLLVMATLVYRDLPVRRTFELMPAVTYSNNRDRASSETWAPVDHQADIGLNIKYGLTSTITLDATFNPDFSQVESDEFQVEVNQRYPIFYKEKRPFFMEGVDIFKMPITGSYYVPSRLNLKTHVHTRRIVDPRWGAKLSGNIGNASLGIVTAGDEAPGRVDLEDGSAPFAGKNKFFAIGRTRYNFGQDNFIGGLFLDTEFADGYNRVAGVDAFYRLGGHQIMGYALLTTARDPMGIDDNRGSAAVGGYQFDNQNLSMMAVGERFDEGFQMDTAFYNRTGITMGHLMASYSIYPDKEKYPWLKLIQPSVEISGGRDRLAGGNEFFGKVALKFNFIKNGRLLMSFSDGREPWAGDLFNIGGTLISGGVQLSKQLDLQGRISWTDAIYYAQDNPFAGSLKSQIIIVGLQPTSKFQQVISYTHEDFDRSLEGERIYTLHIINSQSVYQFTDKFFVRAIFRYDSFEKQLLTDFLASYVLVPGTVVYAGYGSLIERRKWDEPNRRWLPGLGDYLTTRRSFFFKASYLWRF